MKIDIKLSKDDVTVTTKLKCKPCNMFFRDHESYIIEKLTCPSCRGPLKRIRVHNIKPQDIVIDSKNPYKAR